MKDTKKLLREIAKLTNEIDKLLKSNTPKARRLLKSIAGKAREQGVIIADNLTDAELGEVIRKSDKVTKQAIIYAVHNQLPNLKTLHKGKKNIKLDKAIATKKLNYAIAPDKIQVAKSQGELFLEKRYRGAKAKLKREADKKLKEEHPDLWNLLNQEKLYAAQEKKRLNDLKKAEDKRIRELERQKKRELATVEKQKQKERLQKEKEIEAQRQRELNEQRIDAILNLKKSFQTYLNNTEDAQAIKDFARISGIGEKSLSTLLNKDLINDFQKSREFNLAADLLSTKYGFNPNVFLEAAGQDMSKKNLLRWLDPNKFQTTEDTIKFLEALRLVDPYQAQFKELTDYLKKIDRKVEPAEELYVLPKGKLIGLDLQFKSGITAEELTNLKDTLEVFKMVADSPEKLSEDVMNKGGMMMSVYAKLKIETIQLMAKTDSIIAVTMTKQGGESWDSKFWWFATYKSNESTDEGVFVKKGFVVDWKGIHTRLETFLTSINDIISSSETKDDVLIKFGEDIREYASWLKETYNTYKGFYQIGDLGVVDDKGDIKFNEKQFERIAEIGKRYQNLLIETQATLQALRNYCDKAIKFAKDEVSRFLRKMK